MRHRAAVKVEAARFCRQIVRAGCRRPSIAFWDGDHEEASPTQIAISFDAGLKSDASVAVIDALEHLLGGEGLFLLKVAEVGWRVEEPDSAMHRSPRTSRPVRLRTPGGPPARPEVAGKACRGGSCGQATPQFHIAPLCGIESLRRRRVKRRRAALPWDCCTMGRASTFGTYTPRNTLASSFCTVLTKSAKVGRDASPFSVARADAGSSNRDARTTSNRLAFRMLRFLKSLSAISKSPSIKALNTIRIGGLAVMVTRVVTVEPWLCVPAFRQVCSYRINSSSL